MDPKWSSIDQEHEISNSSTRDCNKSFVRCGKVCTKKYFFIVIEIQLYVIIFGQFLGNFFLSNFIKRIYFNYDTKRFYVLCIKMYVKIYFRVYFSLFSQNKISPNKISKIFNLFFKLFHFFLFTLLQSTVYIDFSNQLNKDIENSIFFELSLVQHTRSFVVSECKLNFIIFIIYNFYHVIRNIVCPKYLISLI